MDMEPDMSISNLISLLSGIALFLFGMSLMGDGLKKSFSPFEIIDSKLKTKVVFPSPGSP